MKKHATALRAFTHADDAFAKGEVILSLDGGHFKDWSAPGVDLVREATDAEIARAKGEPDPARRKAPAKRRAKPAAAKPVSAPATTTPPVADEPTEPAAPAA